MRKILRLVGTAALLLTVHVGFARAQDAPAVIGFRNELATTQKIRHVLDEPAVLSFHATPLRDVAAFLGEHFKIQVMLDTKALENAGMQADTPVTLEAKGMTLKSALHHLFRPLDLRYEIRNEALIITTPDTADQDLEVRVYPVADLLRLSADDEPDFDSLIDAITASIKPTTWDSVGGPGSIKEFELRDALVISQTGAIHEEVAALLTELRHLPARKPAPAAQADNGKPVIRVYNVDDRGFGMAGRGNIGGFGDPTPTFANPTPFSPMTELPLSTNRSLAAQPAGQGSTLFQFGASVSLDEAKKREAAMTDAEKKLKEQQGRLAEQKADYARRNRRAKEIAAAVKTLIEPKSWQDAGGEGIILIADGKLVIEQTPPIQEQIRLLLKQLGVFPSR